MSDWRVIHGDVLESLRAMESGSVQTCVTSPPYWGLRDYGHPGQIGLEKSPAEYVAKMVEVFGEVRRVLKDDGTLWLNLGDSYAGGKTGRDDADRDQRLRGVGDGYHDDAVYQSKQRGVPAGLKSKDLVGIPWRVALALQADGWYLRQDIIWHKPNPMPESVTDRCTKAHEYIFLLSKSERYHFDAEAIAEQTTDTEYRTVGKIRPTAEGGTGFEIRGGLHNQPGGRETKNRRSVWTVSPAQFSEAHFATFPPKLIEPCILAGAPEGGTVLDPFNGSGTTGLVCIKHQRRYVGVELNPEYVAMSERRLSAAAAQGVLFAATAHERSSG
jgi:DNA modification methylase